MDSKTSSFLKSSLTHGIILGIIMIIISLAMWMFNYLPIGIGKGILFMLIMVVLYVVLLYIFTKIYRDTVLGGSIKYGHAFLYALAVMVISSLLSALYTYIFNKFIDPEYTTKTIQATITWTEEFMRSKGIPETTISESIEKIKDKGIPSVGKMVFNAIKSGVIMGAICSLLSAAFAKKEGNPLQEN